MYHTIVFARPSTAPLTKRTAPGPSINCKDPRRPLDSPTGDPSVLGPQLPADESRRAMPNIPRRSLIRSVRFTVYGVLLGLFAGVPVGVSIYTHLLLPFPRLTKEDTYVS